MRPLERSIMPLVCGVLGLVRRCSMRLSVQTRSKDIDGGWPAFAGSAEAVSKRLAIIGENLADRERSLVDQTLEAAASGGC